MITDADIPKPEQPTIVLETETVRGGGNRDAPGHSLSWLTRATTVYGHLTEGGAWTARPADGGDSRIAGPRGQGATRDFGSSFRRWRAAWTSTAC